MMLVYGWCVSASRGIALQRVGCTAPSAGLWRRNVCTNCDGRVSSAAWGALWARVLCSPCAVLSSEPLCLWAAGGVGWLVRDLADVLCKSLGLIVRARGRPAARKRARRGISERKDGDWRLPTRNGTVPRSSLLVNGVVFIRWAMAAPPYL